MRQHELPRQDFRRGTVSRVPAFLVLFATRQPSVLHARPAKVNTHVFALYYYLSDISLTVLERCFCGLPEDGVRVWPLTPLRIWPRLWTLLAGFLAHTLQVKCRVSRGHEFDTCLQSVPHRSSSSAGEY